MRDRGAGSPFAVVSLVSVLATMACHERVKPQEAGLESRGSARPVRILPLGDSITEGIDAHSSYRYWLGRGLQEAGVAFDFVGSLRDSGAGSGGGSFDGDHEGHWGWRVDQVAAKLDPWLSAAAADVVLVHLGHNDLGAGEAPAEVAREVTELVTRIRGSDSRPHVLVAEVIPASVPVLAARIEQLNETLVAELRAIADPGVRLVDLATGFDARRRTADGVHPNEEGARWMADRWLDALHDVLEEM